MRLLHPEFLWLLLLVPVVWFLPRRARDVAHSLLRSAALIFLVLGLARPVAVEDEGARHLVVIVDASDSVDEDARASTSKELTGSRADGDEATERHLVWIGDRDVPEAVRDRFGEPRRLATGSPLGAALALANEAVPRGAAGSVILYSDGLSTDLGWGDAVQRLTARGIPVDVRVLSGLRGDLRPVRAEPGGVWRVGRSSRLLVDLIGNGQTARVRLERDGESLAATAPMRVDGATTVALSFEPESAGRVDLEVVVEVVEGADARPDNNRLERSVAVQDPITVLYLGQRQRGGAEKLGKLLGDSFALTAPESLEGESAPAPGAFDLVVLDDRPATAVPLDFQERIVEAVQESGTGLVVSGGAASFGPGGYHETPVAGVLPVEFVQKEEKKDPSTSLAVIIDTSGSMGGQRIVLAKEVTRLAIRRLLPHDKVGIVEFYGAKRWAAPLQSAANAINIQRALNRLDAGGGTVILPAIEEAFYGLKNVQTRYKHVLILTDGGVETGAFEPLLRSMARDGITVSTVLVGPGRHSDFLVQLADWGKGRFYNASDRFNLPEVILKQPSSSRLPAYRPGVHRLKARGGSGWWGDVDPREAPALAGYVETRARPGAEVLLETERESHPVLASWRHGLGRVTAMTTEPTGEGTKSWRDWDGYGRSLARVFERSAGADLDPWRFETTRRGARVEVHASRRDASAGPPRLEWTDPAVSRPVDVPFLKVAEGVYRAEIAMPEDVDFEGRARSDGPRGERFVRLLDVAGSDHMPELGVDPSRAVDLERLARETGGRVGDGPPAAAVFSSAGAPVSLRRIWPVLVLLSLLFYAGDLFWRRRPGRPVSD